MNNISIFNFENLEVRTVVDNDDGVWFVGKDVAKALGYAQPRDAINQHCKGAVKRIPLSTTGGVQELRLINEPDMYALIFGSKLPSAERFKRWVFEEVLPSIRKTGQYTKPLTTEELLVAQSKALLEHKQEIEKVKAEQERIKLENEETKDRFARVEARQAAFEEGFSYFTILGYGAYKGITIDLSTAKSLGKACARLSRERNISIDRVKDARFGQVNAYHESILDELVSELL